MPGEFNEIKFLVNFINNSWFWQKTNRITFYSDMGFDAKASRDALLENNNDIETAVNTTLMAYEKTPHTVYVVLCYCFRFIKSKKENNLN